MHVALLRYWHDAYGAEVICQTQDTIELYLQQPVTSRELAMQVAKEHELYAELENHVPDGRGGQTVAAFGIRREQAEAADQVSVGWGKEGR